jgi:hypothetical protein
MTEEEAQNSADSFAIEFRDMKERRKVLYGPDVIAHLKIEGDITIARRWSYELRLEASCVCGQPKARRSFRIRKLC